MICKARMGFMLDYLPSAVRNSSIVNPALAMRARRVPLATSAWSGIERVAICPSFVRMMRFEERDIGHAGRA